MRVGSVRDSGDETGGLTMDPFTMTDAELDEFWRGYCEWLRETNQHQPPADEPEPDWVAWQDGPADAGPPF
jgi:hypothetical protein